MAQSQGDENPDSKKYKSSMNNEYIVIDSTKMPLVASLHMRVALVALCLFMAFSSQAQAFNPDANHDGQVGAGDVLAVLAVYGLPFSATIEGPSILHFDPDTIGVLPLGYDIYIAENFTFPYLYVTVPDGEYPGQSFKLAVEKQADMDDQQVYLQDTSGNWLTNARQYETNGFYAELVWTGIRWVSDHLE